MKKEVLFNFVFTFFVSITVFIQNKYFIQYMGIETLGIMKLFTQFLQYLSIVELGLGGASAYALYKPLAEKNEEQVSIIISTIKSIYNKISVLLFLLGILFTPFLSYFIKMENFSIDIYLYWIFYLTNTVSTYSYIKYIILFTANQEFIYVRFIQSVSKIFYQILQIICIIKYHSFILFIFLLFFDNLTQYIFFKLHYEKIYSYIYITKERYTELNRDIKNLFWHKIASLFVFNTDLILISKFISIEIVGIYASYQLIVQMISTLIGVVLNVLRPKIGKFIAKNSKDNIYLLFKEINICSVWVAIFFGYITNKSINMFIDLWLGEGLKLPIVTIKLICINIFINVFRGVLDIFKDGSGFFDDIQSPILEAVINLIFSIVLGLKYGLNGIIIGTIISNITIILIYKPILVFKRCFDKGIGEYIKIYGNYLILLLLSLFALNIVIKPFIRESVDTWLEWVVYASTISLITLLTLFIIFLLNKDFREVIKKYILKKNI